MIFYEFLAANLGKNQEFSFRNYFTPMWLSSLSEDFLHANNFCTCTFRSTLMKWELTRNPSIYNMIRWADGQTTRQPSVWCSKYYYRFIKSYKILCKNPLNLFFYVIAKMKIKIFECPKSIKSTDYGRPERK